MPKAIPTRVKIKRHTRRGEYAEWVGVVDWVRVMDGRFGRLVVEGDVALYVEDIAACQVVAAGGYTVLEVTPK